jgi:hypothetical protein
MSGDRNPIEGKFLLDLQNIHEPHPASCTISAGVFLEVKGKGRGAKHAPLSKADITNGLYLYVTSLLFFLSSSRYELVDTSKNNLRLW